MAAPVFGEFRLAGHRYTKNIPILVNNIEFNKILIYRPDMLRKVISLFRPSAVPTPKPAVRKGDFDRELDTRGWNCPVPVLQAKKSLSNLDAGQTLHVITTDPGSLVNLRGLANQPGITLVESSEVGEEYHFVLKKTDAT